MKLIFATIFFSVVLSQIFATSGKCNANNEDKFYSFSGDVYVVGFFDAHFGENCSSRNAFAFQQMYDVTAIVRVLNKIRYVPGITIGLSLYDTCSSKEIATKSFVSSLVDTDCNFTYNLGALVTPTSRNMMENFSKIKNVPIFTLGYEPDPNTLLDIAVRLLMELELCNVDLAVFPSTQLLNTFNNFTASRNICVKRSATFSQYHGTCPGNDQLIVLAIRESELSLLLKLESDCLSSFVIIVLDNNVDLTAITENLLLHDAYLVLPSSIWSEFDIPIGENFETMVSLVEENLYHSNVTMDFIRTAATVMSVVDHFKRKLISDCGNTSKLCSNLTHFGKCDETLLLGDTSIPLNISELLGIEAEAEEENLFQYLILKAHYNTFEYFGKARHIASSTSITVVNFTNPSSSGHEEDTGTCSFAEDCRNCSNYAEYQDTATKIVRFFDEVPFALKSNGWVSSILTLCIIGIISCVSVFAFIVARICKEDILEGNPCSAFLLIFSTILMYLAVLPFCVDIADSKLICAVKLFGTSFCYCLVFSIILSRILMILTCDYNGSFMSHINGYLQSFLCFFMFAVQLALISEFWIFGWILSEVNYCAKFMNGNLFLSYMMYDTFLLVLIASVVPFITKSRRNYKEGLSFTAVTGCFLVIWVFWCFGYFIASPEWKDFCVAVGLSATATSVLVCIFIPRTYLIMTGIVRDRITSAIPTNVSNIVDMNYRSTQALYDSVTTNAAANKKGELNLGYYDDPHSSTSTSRMEIQPRNTFTGGGGSVNTVTNDENNYESCDISNIDQKMTKF